MPILSDDNQGDGAGQRGASTYQLSLRKLTGIITMGGKTIRYYYDCYVYTYASSLTGKVFYVGRGTGNRFMIHLKQARGSIKNPSPVVIAIRSVWQQGGKIIIRKPYNNIPLGKSAILEKELIKQYGYEQLVNRPHWKLKVN